MMIEKDLINVNTNRLHIFYKFHRPYILHWLNKEHRLHFWKNSTTIPTVIVHYWKLLIYYIADIFYASTHKIRQTWYNEFLSDT